jgi:hypothetical protein
MKLPEPNLINKYPTPGHYTTEQMLAWGKACAEAEREECAKVCETPIDEIQITDDCAETVYMGATECADAIRARGNT